VLLGEGWELRSNSKSTMTPESETVIASYLIDGTSAIDLVTYIGEL
jgi:hypothetical protein